MIRNSKIKEEILTKKYYPYYKKKYPIKNLFYPQYVQKIKRLNTHLLYKIVHIFFPHVGIFIRLFFEIEKIVSFSTFAKTNY